MPVESGCPTSPPVGQTVSVPPGRQQMQPGSSDERDRVHYRLYIQHPLGLGVQGMLPPTVFPSFISFVESITVTST